MRMTARVSKHSNPAAVVDRIDNLLNGFKQIPASVQLDVLGTIAAPATLTSELEGRKTLYTTHDQAEVAAKNAKTARDAAQPDTVARVDAIEAAVRSHY